jgi:hypothetical protein
MYVALVGLVIAILGWGSLYLNIINTGLMPGLLGFIVMVVGLTMAGTSRFRLGAGATVALVGLVFVVLCGVPLLLFAAFQAPEVNNVGAILLMYLGVLPGLLVMGAGLVMAGIGALTKSVAKAS